MQAGRGENYEAAVFKVHHAQPGPVLKGLLNIIAEMHHQRTGRVCSQGDPRGCVWNSLRCMDDGCQSPQDWLLLVDRPRGLRRVCEEMHQVSGVRSPAPPEAISTA